MKPYDAPFADCRWLPTSMDEPAVRQCAAQVGRRLWPGEGLASWMVEVPRMSIESLIGPEASQMPALAQTCEAAARLIANSLLALQREPGDERSGPQDAATLVRTVSLLDPSRHHARDAMAVGGPRREFCNGDAAQTCACNALACAIAAGALFTLMETIAFDAL